MSLQAAEVVRLPSAEGALRRGFLGWQCRLRRIAVRQDDGRPSSGMTPTLTLPGATGAMGHIITVLNRAHGTSRTPELRHIGQRTQDAAGRRQAGLEFLCETYYARADDFTDLLTSTFPPGSKGAARIVAAGTVTLDFAQFSQRYRLHCTVRELSAPTPLREATFWHNYVFNPHLPRDCVILGFQPDWSKSDGSS